jgi:hypothetical protein
VLPDKIRPANGVAPSLLVEGVGPEVAVKLCRVVKVCAVTRPDGIKPRQAISAGRRNRQWILVFIEFPGFVYLICMMRFSYDFTPRPMELQLESGAVSRSFENYAPVGKD